VVKFKVRTLSRELEIITKRLIRVFVKERLFAYWRQLCKITDE
jgi:hypothetical protein